jgi:hypothetical protein
MTINYFLKNNGPDRQIHIGLNRVGDFVFILYKIAGGEERIWRDLSRPVTRSLPPPREFFNSGSELSASATVFWQEALPIFGEIGEYSIRMRWIGPDDLIIHSEPITVQVVAP